jgi:thiamine biosynthesis lipoprotein
MFGFSRDSTFRETANNKARSLTPLANHGWIKTEEAIMGTAINVELWCDDNSAGQAAVVAVMEEMHRIDRLMSPHKSDSELSIINRDASHKAVPVCDEMMRLLKRAAYFSEISQGAFDITFAAVGRLFDYRLRKRPSDAQLEQARQAIGYQHLILDEQMQTVRFNKPGMCIDLGGFAKGHAVDNATRLLRQRGIANANVSAGGDSRVIGDRRGRPWMIGVRDPANAEQIIAMLPLIDTSISTSGDYERYFDEDGVRFHHLIDPFTGRSPKSVRSVTILAEDGLTTEAFSKIVFVSGIEKGLSLIETQKNIDAVIVDADGKLHYSSGLLNPN